MDKKIGLTETEVEEETFKNVFLVEISIQRQLSFLRYALYNIGSLISVENGQ